MIEFIKKEVIPFVIIALLVGSTNMAVILSEEDKFESNKKIIIDNQEIVLRFDRKEDEILIYKDKNNDEYLFDNNKLIGYNKNFNKFSMKENINNYKLDSIEDITNLFNIKLDGYKLEKNNNEYLYLKYINNIKTSDGIYILLDKEGILTNFRVNDNGIFDNLMTDITSKDIYEYVSEYLKEENIDTYKIVDMIIEYENNKYLINSLVEYDNCLKKVVYEL